MKNIFCSEQVQILLERMDTHAEDFMMPHSPFTLGGLKPWLELAKGGSFNLVERIIIRRKLKKVARQATKNRIIELLVEKPEFEEGAIGSGVGYGSPAMTIPDYIKISSTTRPTDKLVSWE